MAKNKKRKKRKDYRKLMSSGTNVKDTVGMTNHREACTIQDLCNDDRPDCCHDCAYYGTTPLTSPSGWCNLHGSTSVKEPNTDENEVCDDFKLSRFSTKRDKPDYSYNEEEFLKEVERYMRYNS